MLAEPELEQPLPTGFLCSVSQRGRFRRLHYAGFCWRTPGVHFHEWEDLGPDEPDFATAGINARCSDCFPEAKATKKAEEAAHVDEEEDCSSVSDDCAAQRPRKRRKSLGTIKAASQLSTPALSLCSVQKVAASG